MPDFYVEEEPQYKDFFEGKKSGKKSVKKSGIVLKINKDSIVVNVNGMGERIPYDHDKHSSLSVGDKIDFEEV